MRKQMMWQTSLLMDCFKVRKRETVVSKMDECLTKFVRHFLYIIIVDIIPFCFPVICHIFENNLIHLLKININKRLL